MTNQPYEHGHLGTVIVWALAPVLVLLVGLAMFEAAELGPAGRMIVWAVAVALFLALVLFYKLTVRVDGAAVVLWFGPGWPRKRIPLADIESVATVEKSWLWGYGLRWTPRGWLWRVSGLQAVELRLLTGKSVFIGTDEPGALAEAIRASTR